MHHGVGQRVDARQRVQYRQGELLSAWPRSAASSRKAASKRSGASARVGTEWKKGSIAAHSDVLSVGFPVMPAIFFESRRAHGIKISASAA